MTNYNPTTKTVSEVTPLQTPFAIAVPHQLPPFVTTLDYDSHDLSTLIAIEDVENLLYYRNTYKGHQHMKISTLLHEEINKRLKTALVHNNATDYVLLLVDNYVISAWQATPEIVSDYLDIDAECFSQEEFPDCEPLRKIKDYGKLVGYNGDLGFREEFWNSICFNYLRKKMQSEFTHS